MNVSHFELVYKPQSPEGPADTVLQGYFLKISNLEDVAYSFQLEFVTSPITDADRTLFGNTLVFVDIAGENQMPGEYSLSGNSDAKSFKLNKVVTIPAHGTALVALLPSDPFVMPGDPVPDPNFECRGYVNITLPPVFRPVGDFFLQRKQSDAPVSVLLTPQHRATYLSTDGAINDQTQSSIPLASGTGALDVPPQSPFLIGKPGAFDLDRIRPALEQVELDDSLIVGLVSQIEAQQDGLDAFNTLMAKAGLGLELSRRTSGKAKAKA